MASEPLQRSIAKLKSWEYSTWVVERFIPFPKPGHRLDMFNLIDVVAISAETPGVLGVQACAASGLSSHVAKAKANPFLDIWLAAGNRFVIWGWSKQGERGKRKLWCFRQIEFNPKRKGDTNADDSRKKTDGTSGDAANGAGKISGGLLRTEGPDQPRKREAVQAG